LITKQVEKIPDNYHCHCNFCKKYLGILKRNDGSLYNKGDRKKYYSNEEKHIAKTPLHGNRWCIQTYTSEDDWVLDPTMGAGTTAVEALNHGRNVVGTELEINYYHAIKKNIEKNNPHSKKTLIYCGNALHLLQYLPQKYRDREFVKLVINNPPYSGDFNQTSFGEKGDSYEYHPQNLAFLKENPEYYDRIKKIYAQCSRILMRGGYFCVGVKDMVRNKKPYPLHEYLGKILTGLEFSYEGMVLLPHHPPTLFMNTYQKQYPEVEKIPRYQTLLIFKKV